MPMFLFRSTIHKIITLASAANKHHTDIRYSLKKMQVTEYDSTITIPNRYILLILDLQYTTNVSSSLQIDFFWT
ncbi:MAG TPA: hypothetical protein DCK76_06550 [Desulfotomaculum sp.]|nr:hypothetical protein [Desulfotomaculum sp.]HBY03038.1 hypothetical protein [Desulfotomaculum sp.]